MALETVAILSPGDMGGGFGAALSHHGHDVITCLAGRGAETRARAARAGFRDVADLDTLVAEADIVLSILPPDAALGLARTVAAAMRRTGRAPAYADCNAVSPETAREIAQSFEGTGATFIDGGIIGWSPRPEGRATRLYVSGPDAPLMAGLDGNWISIRQCGPEIGRASAVKMCYASISKGTNALHTAAMTAAEALGVGETVRDEIAESAPGVMERIRANIPRLPCDSGRWVGEMHEIARTFASCGVTPGFHLAAAEVFGLLAATPLGAETKETMDRSRTLEETIRIVLQHLPMREAAE